MSSPYLNSLYLHSHSTIRFYIFTLHIYPQPETFCMHIHIASQFRNWPETLSHSNLCSSSFSLYANDPRKAHVYQDTRHQVQCPNKKKLFWCPWASIRHVQCQQLKNYLLCITKLFRPSQNLSNSQFRDLTTCVPKPPSHTGRMQRVTTNVRLADMPPGRRTQNIKPTEFGPLCRDSRTHCRAKMWVTDNGND